MAKYKCQTCGVNHKPGEARVHKPTPRKRKRLYKKIVEKLNSDKPFEKDPSIKI